MKLEITVRGHTDKILDIDIRYYLMKNRLDTDIIYVVYCPTGEMLTNFYTKPL